MTPFAACGPSPFFFIFANHIAPYVEAPLIAVPSGRRLNSRVESNFIGKPTNQDLAYSANTLRAISEVYRSSAVACFRMGMSGSLLERQHDSRKLQIKSINFLAANVAQHQRGIIRG